MPKGKTILMFLAIALVCLDAWYLSGQAVKGWTMWNATFVGQPLAEAFINTLFFGGETSLTELAGRAGFLLVHFVIGVLLIRLVHKKLRDMMINELVSMKW